MAIHLILFSVNWVHKSLCGNVQVVSGCLGALQRVTYLSPYRIPSRCKHSDILKNISVNCRDLMFSVHYSHIKVHQDDTTAFDKLSWKLQLNCICNHLTKQCLNDGVIKPKGGSQLFPLEPIGIFMGAEKLSSETGPLLQFHAHHQPARIFFITRNYCRAMSLRRLIGNWSTTL
jgi:hypothetical protein